MDTVKEKFSDNTNSICTLFNCGNGMFEGDKYSPFYIHPETNVNIDNKMKKFNNTLANTRLMIKPTNSVWDGGTQTIAGKYDWWMNSLIIFGVDGSLHNRDNSNYEEVNDEDLLSDEILCDASHILSSDDAWRLARAFLNRERRQKLMLVRKVYWMFTNH